MIAFLMGMIGHGVGDEVWDWLFEPDVADLEEYYTPVHAGWPRQRGRGRAPARPRRDRRLTASPPPRRWPSRRTPTSWRRSMRSGFTDIDERRPQPGPDRHGRGPPGRSRLGTEPTSTTSTRRCPGRRTTWSPLPAAWTSPRPRSPARGTRCGAGSSASQPATQRLDHLPGPDERRVPATGWNRSIQPGSARGRGGARNADHRRAHLRPPLHRQRRHRHQRAPGRVDDPGGARHQRGRCRSWPAGRGACPTAPTPAST